MTYALLIIKLVTRLLYIISDFRRKIAIELVVIGDS